MQHSLWADEEGLATIEYALLLLLMALAAIGAYASLGTSLGTRVSDIADNWPSS